MTEHREPDDGFTSGEILDPTEVLVSDRLTAWLRTVVPGLWAALVAWLATLGVPDTITDTAANLGQVAVVPVVLGLVYAGLRRLEPHMPTWLVRVFLGSAKPPSYPPVTLIR